MDSCFVVCYKLIDCELRSRVFSNFAEALKFYNDVRLDWNGCESCSIVCSTLLLEYGEVN